MEERLSEEEVRAFLQSVERGDITLIPSAEPQDVYAGTVSYRASNGWSIAVFNDCNEWDYIDWIETPDGRLADFGDSLGEGQLGDYEPTEQIAWSRYRIPGYLRFRCEHCGVWLKDGADRRNHLAGCKRLEQPPDP